LPADWLRETAQGTVLLLHVQPKASRTQVAGVHGDRLKIRLAAPPVDGAANEELLRFLKESIAFPGARYELARGHASRRKDVLCAGVPPERVRAALEKPE
jgi:uncharacterized protein